MSSDMVAALARATADGHTFFGYNANRPRGEVPTLVHAPGRSFAPGEAAHAAHVAVPQVRHTWAVLAGRAGVQWGYLHGVNEKGVAIGYTPIRTRLRQAQPGLTGPDLVRLTLERAGSALQAAEVLTGLIERYGQHDLASGGDCAFLIADCREACVVEAAERHWVLAVVGSVRAVTGEAMLRQDWDRISRGLSDLAISNGWYPADGHKLDFAGAVGRHGPDRVHCLRRWGQLTLGLEQHSGVIDKTFLRTLLRGQAEAVCPAGIPPADAETVSSFLVRLGPAPEDLPVAWCALGSPAASVYLPLLVTVELPGAAGEQLWRMQRHWQEEARRVPRVRAALQTEVEGVQQRLDEHAREFLPEANGLWRAGRHDDLQRLAGSFVQHCFEQTEDLSSSLRLEHEEEDEAAALRHTIPTGADF